MSSQKQHMKNNVLKIVQENEGNVKENPVTLLDGVRTFYEKLYSSEETCGYQRERISNSIQKTDFEEEMISDLEREINEKDLFFALCNMNKDKSPGLDGLTVEFYRTIWSFIKDDYVQVVKTCNKCGVLPNTLNTALIRFIFKKRGDRSDLKNWRPINVDYKIIAKALANRFQIIMPHIIQEEQSYDCEVYYRQ